MRYPIADAHCDYLFGAMEYGYDIETPCRDQTICLPNLRAGGVALQFFAAWSDENLGVPPFAQTLIMIDRFHTMLERCDAFVPLTAAFSPDSGKIAAVLTVEGAEGLCGSPSILRDWYRLGVRAVTFTWNTNNELAGAAQGKRQKGLTTEGREMLSEMNRLGMAFDVSHLSDAGIEDALSYSRAPIFASHSNCRALANAPRCLEDDFIRAIAKMGGVVGVNFYGPQLAPSGKAEIRDIVRHICRVVHLGGIGAACIGSDFDGMQRYPRDLKNSSDLPALCRALEAEGFTQSEVQRIAYQNLHDFILPFAIGTAGC